MVFLIFLSRVWKGYGLRRSGRGHDRRKVQCDGSAGFPRWGASGPGGSSFALAAADESGYLVLMSHLREADRESALSLMVQMDGAAQSAGNVSLAALRVNVLYTGSRRIRV